MGSISSELIELHKAEEPRVATGAREARERITCLWLGQERAHSSATEGLELQAQLGILGFK